MEKPKNNIDASNGVFKRATRSQNNTVLKAANKLDKVTNAASKRKAVASPDGKDATKRTAFVDLTNNGAGKLTFPAKKGTAKAECKEKTSNENKAAQPLANLASGPKPRAPIQKYRTVRTDIAESTSKEAIKVSTISSNLCVIKTKVSRSKAKLPPLTKAKIEPAVSAIKTRFSGSKAKLPSLIKGKIEQKADAPMKKESVEDPSPQEGSRVPGSGSSSTDNTFSPDVAQVVPRERKSSTPVIPKVPANVNDFDREQLKDPGQVAVYAMDIFNYLRERESSFKIRDYMDDQFCLTQMMRSLLVDWMVEVQETFELNHEALFLAMKLVDIYLSKVMVAKETLQLIGAASMLIASKYDERSPPLIEDFLYICDGAYSQKELIKAEINVFKTIGYDLGIPLSYRFLRRYARCVKVNMPILTLARFILESSLMDYQFVSLSDSKMAAACLLLALEMSDISGWTPTLEYYTSYKYEEIKTIVLLLNNMLHRPHEDNLNTIRNKYSHQIFYAVAKRPLISNIKLM